MSSVTTKFEVPHLTDIEVLPTFISGRGVLEKELTIKFSKNYNRLSNENLETLIQRVWNEQCLKNKSLFDGKKFRLKDASTVVTGVKLELGLTSYKEFIGTNLLPKALLKDWLDLGKNNCGDATAYLSNPLGNDILLKSKDHQFVFIRRSKNVTEAQGMIDLPGGHPEPEFLPLPIVDASSDVLAKEIFDSIIREVEDEINISREYIHEVQMIGIVYNKASAGRPCCVFLARCSLTAEEMKTKYCEGSHKEAFESTEVIFIPEDELKAMPASKSVPYSDITLASKGAIYLYQKLSG